MKAYLLLGLLAGSAHAQLVWDKTNVEVCAVPGDGKVEAAFPFRNTGSYPVKISRLESSCDCTTTRLKQSTIAPGETGEVVAVFEFGRRLGRHAKTIDVHTVPRTTPPVELTLVADIAQKIELDRSLLLWTRNAPATPQDIRVKVVQQEPLRGLRAISSDPRLAATVQEISPGREYVVRVAPSDTASPLRAELKLLAEGAAGQFSQSLVRVRVK